MGLKDFFFGKRPGMKKVPTMAPYQQESFMNSLQNPIQNNPLYQQGQSYLQNLLSNNPEDISRYSEPYIRNLNENIAPGLATNFAYQGTGAGGLRSSSFNNALAQAAQNTASDIAGMRLGAQQQGLGQALNYSQQPYVNNLAYSQTPTFAYGSQQGTPGFLNNLASGLGGAFSGGFGSQLGGSFANQFLSPQYSASGNAYSNVGSPY